MGIARQDKRVAPSAVCAIAFFCVCALLSCADHGEWEPDVGWDYIHRPHEKGPAPEWLAGARFGSVFTARDLRESVIDSLLAVRVVENCSVALIDDTLSYDMDEAGFAAACERVRRAAEGAHARGMKAALYVPALEMLSIIEESGESFGSRHKDWLQRGLDGTPNVFRGTEVWVGEGTESAWLSPNSGFRAFFLDRIRKLARLPIDAL
ncbi:MAG: hypothetical protein HKN20_16095, partial [Gemmatimonadetes bacterium]|nr:hypothetical protein [Gemmatimonadota bacterium]